MRTLIADAPTAQVAVTVAPQVHAEHGGYARHADVVGRIVFSRNQSDRVLWLVPVNRKNGAPIEGAARIMFSYRADNVWRAFPGPANGAPLEILTLAGDPVNKL